MFHDLVNRKSGPPSDEVRITPESEAASIVDAPVVDGPAGDASVKDVSVVDASVGNASVGNVSVGHGQAGDEPVVDDLIVDAPVVDSPVVDAPVVDVSSSTNVTENNLMIASVVSLSYHGDSTSNHDNTSGVPDTGEILIIFLIT